MSAKHTPEQELREMFDRIISTTTDPDALANRELLREYFCNSGFRNEMHNYVAGENTV